MILKPSVIYAIFAVSGATALVYQVVWSRWLGLVFGNTTLSVSIVLGSFMAGLAVGSWLAGKSLRRITNPLTAYALMELGIGLFALGFSRVSHAADLLFTVFVKTEELNAYALTVRAALSVAVLLIPTTLMGATLPLLTDVVRRNHRGGRSWRVGLLYAANTIGAAAGVLGASFFLIELVGIRTTTQIAACLNVIVAVGAYALAQVMPLGPLDDDAGSTVQVGRDGRLAIALVTGSGALALGSEVLWTRTLETLLGNSTYAFATLVLLYLVGIAAGSWAMSLAIHRLRNLETWLTAMQLGMGTWTVAAVYLFMRLVDAVSPYSGVMVPMSTILSSYAEVVSLLVPLAVMSGACFPLATRLIDPQGADARGGLVARAYAWNTLGALVGSFAAGFWIAPKTDFFQALYLIALLYALAAMAACIYTGSRRLTLSVATLTGCSIALAGFSSYAVRSDRIFANNVDRKHPEWVVSFHKPGLQGVTTVIRRRSEKMGSMLLVNGSGMTVKAINTKMMAHLPMLLHPDPRDTLVICFGMGTTYRSAVSHGKNVTAVELVGEVVDAFDQFYADAPTVRAYPRGRIVVNDGRNFLKLTQKQFDVITVDPPPPIDAAGVNNLYSKEFLELARGRLKKGGILAHWVPLPRSLSGIETEEEVVRLVTTFSDVFPYAYAFRGLGGIHLLGADMPLTVSMESIRARLQAPAIAADLNEWDSVPLSRFEDIQLLVREAQAPPPVTDDQPILEFYLLRTLRSGAKKMHPINFW